MRYGSMWTSWVAFIITYLLPEMTDTVPSLYSSVLGPAESITVVVPLPPVSTEGVIQLLASISQSAFEVIVMAVRLPVGSNTMSSSGSTSRKTTRASWTTVRGRRFTP